MIHWSDVYCAIMSLLLLTTAIRGIRTGRFDSIYGANVVVRKDREPLVFWIHAAIILTGAAIIGWAAFSWNVGPVAIRWFERDEQWLKLARKLPLLQ